VVARKRAARPHDALPVLGQPPPVRERADAARNRELILKAARKMLKKQPFGEICMDALADTAGVGKGTLYRRFPDRAALVHALLDHDARDLQGRALAGFGLPKNASQVDRALAFLSALFDFTVEHAPLLCEGLRGSNVARFEHPAHAWQRQTISGHLRAAVRSGEIAPLDPIVTAELMLASVAPEVLRWLVSQSPSAGKLKDSILELWRRTLR
jgi:AcrR family transcriptional regulator